MSIYRLMREDGTRPRKPAGNAQTEWDERVLQGTTDGEAAAPRSVIEALSRYVPSEVLALYTAVLPFMVTSTTPLDSQDETVRWIVAGVIAVIAELYAIGLYRRERRTAELDVSWRAAVGRCTIVLVAFTAWVCAVAGSPFNAFSWYTPDRGALIGLLAGALLTAVSYALEA